MVGQMGFGRRRLGLGVGALGINTLLPPFISSAHAQTPPATIGTFPAGVGADSVFIGITVPITGAYSADGQDLQRGYQLALDLINAGDPIAAKWGLSGKGVLGKQLKYGFTDSELKPNVAVQAQTQYIQRDKAIMITGSVSSAEAIAVQELANRERVLNMVGTSGSNDTTGKNCQRYGFRSQQQSYMAAKAMAPTMAKIYGKSKKAAYLVPDYSYGHSVFDSTSEFMKPFGWTVQTKQVVPLGASDYSSALLNIANSGADVFVNACFAGDAVTSTKQADQFGVLSQMRMVVPNLSSFQAQESGSKLMDGVLGSFDWYWKLQDRYPLSKDFVDAFQAKFKRMPHWSAHIGYMQTLLWGAAVERAKSFNPVDIIKTFEASKSQPFPSTLGPVWYRAEDHQLVRPVPIVIGKKPSDMKNAEDDYDILDVVSGEDCINPPDALGCHLGPYF
jgi:ABC-type branched-subunit amino acid transport system substrate-binding protein